MIPVCHKGDLIEGDFVLTYSKEYSYIGIGQITHNWNISYSKLYQLNKIDWKVHQRVSDETPEGDIMHIMIEYHEVFKLNQSEIERHIYMEAL